MSFEIYQVQHLKDKLLNDSECCMGKDGSLSFNVSVAEEIGINGADLATILIDRGTFRLAIRSPRDGEPTLKLKRSHRRFSLNVRGALKQMGLKAPAKATRFRLEKKPKDGIIFVTLSDLT